MTTTEELVDLCMATAKVLNAGTQEDLLELRAVLNTETYLSPLAKEILDILKTRVDTRLSDIPEELL